MIIIKSKNEIDSIARACQIAAKVLEELKKEVRPGITTAELDAKAGNLITGFKATPAFKGYRGFPGNICASINEEVVHGIPGPRKLKEGDILSLDVGAKLDGYFGDYALTVPVGQISKQAENLLRATREALRSGINEVRPEARVSDISWAIQHHVESHGYSVVRDFVGHGVGNKIHEDPQIPNFGQPHTGPRLKPGMVLAIEPMVNMGGYEVEVLKDGWTAVTKDRSLSAHFEHAVAVTEEGAKVLTNVA